MNPFFARLLEANGYRGLQEASRATNIPLSSLCDFADPERENKAVKAHLKAAEAFGISVEAWLKGLIGDHE